MNSYLKYLNTSQRKKVKKIVKHPTVIYWDDDGIMHEEEIRNAYLVSLIPGYEFKNELNKSMGTAKIAASIKEIKFCLDRNVIEKGSE